MFAVRFKTAPTKYAARGLATHVPPKREGDISSVFVSLSGVAPAPLPPRFTQLKQKLVQGHEGEVISSWPRLIKKLKKENEKVAAAGPAIVPQIEYKNLATASQEFKNEIRKRGVAVIKSVIPEDEARDYKSEIEKYLQDNPSTKAFPPNDPQVYELYWSPAQVRARANANLLDAQTSLMELWNASSTEKPISTSQPLLYADRVRIRQPGDTSFALGPHIDGGSVERWEPNGYGRGGVYNKIFSGNWEKYDPWDASSRVSVVSDLYNGAGACSMFRMFQGWLSMSHTQPWEGTLMVNPLLQLSTVYTLLRPFFKPINTPVTKVLGDFSTRFLDADNWVYVGGAGMTSELHGATPGHGQELTAALHPHLELERTMVHIPKIIPGDFVVWHCDTIHAVDKVHRGATDSSVLYIPVCPITELNASYVARQRDAFLLGTPGPDFPGGKGESQHIGRPTENYIREKSSLKGLQAMGLEKLVTAKDDTVGAKRAVDAANAALGFD